MGSREHHYRTHLVWTGGTAKPCRFGTTIAPMRSVRRANPRSRALRIRCFAATPVDGFRRPAFGLTLRMSPALVSRTLRGSRNCRAGL